MEDIIEESDLVVLNNGQPTHFNINNGQLSAIDLTLSSSSLASKCNWYALDEPHDSDHFPIFTIISDSSCISNPLQENIKWNYSKANWLNYQKQIKMKTSQMDVSRTRH